MTQWKLYLISALGNTSAGIFAFTVPQLFTEADSSLLSTGLTGSCLMGGYVLTAFLSGVATDKYGYRNTLTVGGVLSLSAALLAMFSGNKAMLYGAMALLGSGNGFIFPATIAALTSTCRPEENSRVLLFYTFSWNIGLFIGVPLSGQLFDEQRATQLAFYVALGCAAGVLLFSRLLPQVRPQRAVDGGAGEPPDKRFAVIGWTGLFAGIVAIAMLQFLFPKLAHALEIGPILRSRFMVSHRAVGLLTYVVLFFWTFWRHRLSVIIGANCLGAACMAGMYLFNDKWWLFAAFVSCSIYLSIVYFKAIYYAAHAFSVHKKGLAGGINESIISAGFVVGPAIGGLIGDKTENLHMPFLFAAVLIAVLGIFQIGIFIVWKAKNSE